MSLLDSLVVKGPLYDYFPNASNTFLVLKESNEAIARERYSEIPM
jgi:hypothetical protein